MMLFVYSLGRLQYLISRGGEVSREMCMGSKVKQLLKQLVLTKWLWGGVCVCACVLHLIYIVIRHLIFVHETKSD